MAKGNEDMGSSFSLVASTLKLPLLPGSTQLSLMIPINQRFDPSSCPYFGNRGSTSAQRRTGPRLYFANCPEYLAIIEQGNRRPIKRGRMREC